MTDLSFSEDGCTAYLAVLFLDLNGFKSVNDTAGHEADEGADVAPLVGAEFTLPNPRQTVPPPSAEPASNLMPYPDQAMHRIKQGRT